MADEEDSGWFGEGESTEVYQGYENINQGFEEVKQQSEEGNVSQDFVEVNENQEYMETDEASAKLESGVAQVLNQGPEAYNMEYENEVKQEYEAVDNETAKEEVKDEATEEEVKDEATEEEVKDGGGHRKSKKKKPQKSELDVGISEYLGTHPGFFGIIKQRYSDFVVNEIANSGDIIQLTDETVPKAPETVTEMPDEYPPELTREVLDQLDDLVGVPRPPRIGDGPATDEPRPEVNEVYIDVNGVSKEGRKRIHHAVKATYHTINSFLQEKPDGSKCIVIQRQKGGGTVFIPKRNTWPKYEQYTTFVLYKENMDTMEAINHLSWGTKIKANIFCYAGTKDRRAKTSQLVSVPKVPPRKLVRATKQLPMHLGNFQFMSKPQKLGNLRGNRFGIVIREVKADDDVIMSSINSLREEGFINYFGSQRFGTSQVPTHSIGLQLLKSNWEKAVNLILAPRMIGESTADRLEKCRRVWKDTGSAEDALSVLKGEFNGSIEGKLLLGLKDRQRNDLVGALGMIPRNTRILYLHAYQSYIWNKVVSRRVKKYGIKALPGDIIRRKDQRSESEKDEDLDLKEIDEENEDENTPADTAEENSPADTAEAEEENDHIPTDTADDKKNGNPKTTMRDMTNFHFLTEEEAETTPISDVLLPLPGYRIAYPQNEIKEWYEEFLAEDGLTIESLNNRVKCYSVTGNFRRLVVRPEVTGFITYYNDPTKPLIQSDMDKLHSIPVEHNRLKEGKFKAVVLEMTLPLSTYATMALRELLKMDTSSEFQTTLNSSEHLVVLDQKQQAVTLRDIRKKSHRGKSPKGDFHGRGHGGDFRGRGHRNDFLGRGNRGQQFHGRGDRGHHFRGKGGREDRGYSGREDRGYGGREDRGYSGRGNRGHSGRGDRGHSFRGRGRGEKRNWWGNQKGGKRAKFSF